MRLILVATFFLALSFSPILVAANSDASCSVTVGIDEIPGAPFPKAWKGQKWHGSESLAVQLPEDGLWPTSSIKFFWWSVGFKPGMESHFSAEIASMDDAPSTAKISGATNAGLAGRWKVILAGFHFPDPGCWRISAKYFDHELTFVVKTVDVAEWREARRSPPR